MIFIGIALLVLSFIMKRNDGAPSARQLRKDREEEKEHDRLWIAELDKNIAKDRRKRFGRIRKNNVKDYDQIWMN